MNIAVFLPNWIGDAVMATPALRALREHYRGARLVGVLRPYIAGVLEGSPWFDALIPLDPHGPWGQGTLGAAARLRREKIDLAVILPNSFRSALVAWLGNCRRRLGYARHGRRWLLTDAVEPVRDARGQLQPSPILDAYNLLAGRAGCPAPTRRLEVFTTPRDEAAAAQVWQQAEFHRYPEVVCLNPGAAFGSAKYWPVEYFGRLARKLADLRGSGVLVLCGPHERRLARDIVDIAGRPGVHSLADRKLWLGLTKACIRRADMLVTTDSGPRHLGTAFDVPVVTLFGPTHAAWTETYHPLAVNLQKPVPCGPCQRRVCPLDHRCMTELTPDEVFHAAAGLLRQCA